MNLTFAWCWFLMGVVTGTIQGLWFHRDEWWGGYSSWSRRLSRLGHIAFFGTGLLNLCFALTISSAGLKTPLIEWASVLLIIGAISMSIVCYLAAWKKPLRHLFFIPVISLFVGVGFTASALLLQSPL